MQHFALGQRDTLTAKRTSARDLLAKPAYARLANDWRLQNTFSLPADDTCPPAISVMYSSEKERLCPCAASTAVCDGSVKSD